MASNSKEKIAFIINPKSGRRKNKRKTEFVLRHLDKRRYSPIFHFTEYPGHATELCQIAIADGCKKIVAVGGDGTVNEVAASLVNTNVSLGIVPTGSGNGLARHLNIPLQISEAINLINIGNVISIDAGKINEKWFFCTCGIGFDARIGHRFKKIKKRGFAGYFKMVMQEYTQYKPRKYQFSIDGEEFTRKAFLITIANASQYGNDAFIAPDAKINDGLFDVCIIKPFPIHKGFNLGVRLFNKSLQNSKYHEVIQGKSIRFKKPKKKYIFHIDGEPAKFKKEKIQIEIQPHTLKVLAP